MRCFDPQSEARESLHERCRIHLESMVAGGLLDSTAVEGCLSRLLTCASESEALADAALVSEAALEELPLKQALFVRMEELAPADCVLTSTTSSHPMTSIAAHMRDPSRALVLHPFNPPHLLPVVEVVPGERTAPAVVDAAVDFLRRAGKTPVRLRREVPGFVVNRLQLALLREAWALLDAGVASAEDIDASVRGSLGVRLAGIGPLRATDFAGLDIWARIAANVQLDSGGALPPTMQRLLDMGHKGAKTGRGFYDDYGSPGAREALVAARDRASMHVLQLGRMPRANDP